MRIDVLTLFPDMFQSVLNSSILKRAAKNTPERPAPVQYHLTDIRGHSNDKHGKVDQPPYGGGPGMVVQCQPIWDAVQAVEAEDPDVLATRILMSPQGRRLDQRLSEQLTAHPRLLLIAGHYEGIDQRVIDRLQPLMEISIGDYVLSGGELAAMVLIDAIVRLVPGVIGDQESLRDESFTTASGRTLDYPHYTRPAVWMNQAVPEVLRSGNHAKIQAWQQRQSEQRTANRRPDLLERHRRNSRLSSVIEAIGDTPLVELSRITRHLNGRILAKLDYLNPGHSKKDRIARQIIEDAERAGLLRAGDTVVELTSGNTGTGLAIVCGILGYPFVAVMSRGNSPERARMMRALGAEVVLVDQDAGSKPGEVSGKDLHLVEEATQELVRKKNAFRADQFRIKSNFLAHAMHTGPEIIAQAEGPINAYCDFVGTGGTFSGCAAAMKKHDPSTKCFVVEPEDTAVLAGRPVTNPNHPIQGGGYSMPKLPHLRPELIDGYLTVSGEEAVQTARRLAAEEGIFAGFSSGANVAAALDLLRGVCAGGTVVTMINDSGLKYFSTNLWL